MSVRPVLGWSSGDPATRVAVTYPGDAHLLTVAQPGTGKSRAVAMPNLIRYEGSMFVLDFKGELAKATALWRSVMLGQEVVIFDPFEITGGLWTPEAQDDQAR